MKEVQIITISNVWEHFKNDLPVIWRIPVLGTWCFGVYAKQYFITKFKE